ncbi:hypothetical protein ECANGB1_2619 [Enterospora canceri]|uniref:Secreted protein n=1 Tax=Enterospora canceri TaxID=1081671 RepID=A0A1Y1SAC0_9MICR|nr:hypothetical protein ECANGB1_2619 [Enterospora canceri]
MMIFLYFSFCIVFWCVISLWDVNSVPSDSSERLSTKSLNKFCISPASSSVSTGLMVSMLIRLNSFSNSTFS